MAWMNCDTCKYYRAYNTRSELGEEPSGMCRRYPPMLFAVGGDQFDPDAFHYPTVLANGGCGEYKDKYPSDA